MKLLIVFNSNEIFKTFCPINPSYSRWVNCSKVIFVNRIVGYFFDDSGERIMAWCFTVRPTILVLCKIHASRVLN